MQAADLCDAPDLRAVQEFNVLCASLRRIAAAIASGDLNPTRCAKRGADGPMLPPGTLESTKVDQVVYKGVRRLVDIGTREGSIGWPRSLESWLTAWDFGFEASDAGDVPRGFTRLVGLLDCAKTGRAARFEAAEEPVLPPQPLREHDPEK